MKSSIIILFSIWISLAPINIYGQFRTQQLYGKQDFYFTMSMMGGQVQNPFHDGHIETSFSYQSIDLSGGKSDHQFNSNWEIPSIIHNPVGGQFNFELGNHGGFIVLGIGGFEKIATIFTVGVGANIYVPINCHSKLFDKSCLAIKPSISFGFGQSEPFNRSGNDFYLLGQIDNKDKTIEAFGYKFESRYTTSSKNNPPVTHSANSLDIYFLENYTFLLPRISIGKNNYERIFYMSIDIGYFIPLKNQQGLQLTQDKFNSEKTIWLGDQSSTLNYNGQSISAMPSLLNGFFVGGTIGINLSRETIHTYPSGLKKTETYDKVCNCSEKKNKIQKTKRSKTTKQKKRKENLQNTKGW